MNNISVRSADKKYKNTNIQLLNLGGYISLMMFVIFSLGFFLFLSYTFALGIATKSIMITAISAAITFFTGAVATFFVLAFIKIQKKKNEDAPIESSKNNDSIKITKNSKPTYASSKVVEIVSIVMLSIGIIATIASACLGSTKSANWQIAKENFLKDNGYFASDPTHYDISYPITKDNNDSFNITLNLKAKNVHIRYEDRDSIKISYKNLYKNQIELTPTYIEIKNDDNEKTEKKLVINDLEINETPSPKKNEPLENMLFFFFDESASSKTIIIRLPQSLKNNVNVNGNYQTV